ASSRGSCVWISSPEQQNLLRRTLGNEMSHLLRDVFSLEYISGRPSCRAFVAGLYSTLIFQNGGVGLLDQLEDSSLPPCGCTGGKCPAQTENIDWFALGKMGSLAEYEHLLKLDGSGGHGQLHGGAGSGAVQGGGGGNQGKAQQQRRANPQQQRRAGNANAAQQIDFRGQASFIELEQEESSTTAPSTFTEKAEQLALQGQGGGGHDEGKDAASTGTRSVPLTTES
ncbi:unnamed protein product, partial [Amoebophrya sp. A25]